MDSKTDISKNEDYLQNDEEPQEGWSAEEEILPNEGDLEFEDDLDNQAHEHYFQA
jgi:hypothetical protein